MVSAVFIIVVLAGLAAAMANLSVTRQASFGLDVQGAQAYQAARSGIEWALYKSLRAAPGTACPATTSFKSAAPTLSAFTITATCADATDNAQIVMRQLTVIACNQPHGNDCPGTTRTENYVERRIQVRVQRP